MVFPTFRPEGLEISTKRHWRQTTRLGLLHFVSGGRLPSGRSVSLTGLSSLTLLFPFPLSVREERQTVNEETLHRKGPTPSYSEWEVVGWWFSFLTSVLHVQHPKGKGT